MRRYSPYFYAAIAFGVFALICFSSFIGFCAGLPGVELENSGRGRWIALGIGFACIALVIFVFWPRRYRRGFGERVR